MNNNNAGVTFKESRFLLICMKTVEQILEKLARLRLSNEKLEESYNSKDYDELDEIEKGVLKEVETEISLIKYLENYIQD